MQRTKIYFFWETLDLFGEPLGTFVNPNLNFWKILSFILYHFSDLYIVHFITQTNLDAFSVPLRGHQGMHPIINFCPHIDPFSFSDY